eukprot:TRINITY_DN6808_c0_g1_i1.p1 TRINITY_DN6808_c0_g1~~TRINITY_DN6808_c0_g1_i1.p1  ORF type:complete len:1140 (+),score=225.76 TRINITY_DN6808_c0_g1_i1:118-3537(+)
MLGQSLLLPQAYDRLVANRFQPRAVLRCVALWTVAMFGGLIAILLELESAWGVKALQVEATAMPLIALVACLVKGYEAGMACALLAFLNAWVCSLMSIFLIDGIGNISNVAVALVVPCLAGMVTRFGISEAACVVSFACITIVAFLSSAVRVYDDSALPHSYHVIGFLGVQAVLYIAVASQRPLALSDTVACPKPDADHFDAVLGQGSPFSPAHNICAVPSPLSVAARRLPSPRMAYGDPTESPVVAPAIPAVQTRASAEDDGEVHVNMSLSEPEMELPQPLVSPHATRRANFTGSVPVQTAGEEPSSPHACPEPSVPIPAVSIQRAPGSNTPTTTPQDRALLSAQPPPTRVDTLNVLSPMTDATCITPAHQHHPPAFHFPPLRSPSDDAMSRSGNSPVRLKAAGRVSFVGIDEKESSEATAPMQSEENALDREESTSSHNPSFIGTSGRPDLGTLPILEPKPSGESLGIGRVPSLDTQSPTLSHSGRRKSRSPPPPQADATDGPPPTAKRAVSPPPQNGAAEGKQRRGSVLHARRRSAVPAPIEPPRSPTAMLPSPKIRRVDSVGESPTGSTENPAEASGADTDSVSPDNSRRRGVMNGGARRTGAVRTVEKTVQWRKGDLLGQGGFGKVYLGYNQETGTLMAVKSIEFSSTDKQLKQRLQQLALEIKIMAPLDHPHIVKHYFTERSGLVVNIFMEYVPGGSLHTILDSFGRLEEDVVVQYTHQILEGIAHLHSLGIIHRDIKSCNVLMTVDGVCKLADFGASTIIDQGKRAADVQGTPFWMAPEVLREEEHGWEADIWSLGCTVMEMLTAKQPWAHLGLSNGIEVCNWICEGTDVTLPEGLSVASETFLMDCLTRDASKRWPAKELLDHPFFFEDADALCKEMRAAAEAAATCSSLLDLSVHKSPASDGATSPDAALEASVEPPAPERVMSGESAESFGNFKPFQLNRSGHGHPPVAAPPRMSVFMKNKEFRRSRVSLANINVLDTAPVTPLNMSTRSAANGARPPAFGGEPSPEGAVRSNLAGIIMGGRQEAPGGGVPLSASTKPLEFQRRVSQFLEKRMSQMAIHQHGSMQSCSSGSTSASTPIRPPDIATAAWVDCKANVQIPDDTNEKENQRLRHLRKQTSYQRGMSIMAVDM